MKGCCISRNKVYNTITDEACTLVCWGSKTVSQIPSQADLLLNPCHARLPFRKELSIERDGHTARTRVYLHKHVVVLKVYCQNHAALGGCFAHSIYFYVSNKHDWEANTIRPQYMRLTFSYGTKFTKGNLMVSTTITKVVFCLQKIIRITRLFLFYMTKIFN